MMPKIVNKSHSPHVFQDNTYTTQNKKALGEYWCGTGQRPSES